MPDLKILVAHAGAALPSLIGRLDSCVQHDIAIAKKLRHAPSEYFKRLYFDAISYNTPALEALVKMVHTYTHTHTHILTRLTAGWCGAQVGGDRIMFGTDNPFFPPPVSTALPQPLIPLTTLLLCPSAGRGRRGE